MEALQRARDAHFGIKRTRWYWMGLRGIQPEMIAVSDGLFVCLLALRRPRSDRHTLDAE